MNKFYLKVSLSILGLVFCTTACTPEPKPTTTATPTNTPTITSTIKPTNTATPTLIPDGPVATPTLPKEPESDCPGVGMVYQLDFVYRNIQNMPQAHIETIADPDSAFYFTVHEDNSIDNNDFEDVVLVSINGTTGDCVLEGSSEMRAEIHGQCVDGIAKLNFTGYWENITTTATCPGSTQSTNLEGLFSSAPEDRFELNLNETGDTYVLEADVGILSTYISWTLNEYGLAIVPLVPTPQD